MKWSFIFVKGRKETTTPYFVNFTSSFHSSTFSWSKSEQTAHSSKWNCPLNHQKWMLGRLRIWTYHSHRNNRRRPAVESIIPALFVKTKGKSRCSYYCRLNEGAQAFGLNSSPVLKSIPCQIMRCRTYFQGYIGRIFFIFCCFIKKIITKVIALIFHPEKTCSNNRGAVAPEK